MVHLPPLHRSHTNTTLPPAFHGHVAGCYENADGHIIFDLTVADGNVFFFFPPDDAPPASLEKRNKLSSPTVRWLFDPATPSHTRVAPHDVFHINGEFSRIDDRRVTKPYNHFWQAQVDASRPYDFAKCGPPAGGLFNAVGHFSWDGRGEDTFWAGPTATFQEPTFVPKKGSEVEGEGWLVALQNHLDVLRNDVVILDALDVAKGPVAVIHLPFKLKLGLHGNWVDAREIREWRERRSEGGSVGPARAAERPLPWQVRFGERNGEGSA